MSPEIAYYACVHCKERMAQCASCQRVVHPVELRFRGGAKSRCVLCSDWPGPISPCTTEHPREELHADDHSATTTGSGI